jgi:hypothetical protein
MTAVISFKEAKRVFIENHRMASSAPNTFPHVVDGSIEKGKSKGLDTLYYDVNSGGRMERVGWIYEADYPSK